MYIAYVVKSIDLNGDTINDGDLFMKFSYRKRGDVVTAKLLKVKYLNNAEVKKLVKRIVLSSKAGGGAPPKQIAPQVAIVENATTPSASGPTVVVEQRTSFGNALTTGVGIGAGAAVGSAVVDGLFGMFSE
jgi:hypothetical protein